MKLLSLAAFLFTSLAVCISVTTPSVNTKPPSTAPSTATLEPRADDLPPSLAPKGEITCNLRKKKYSAKAVTIRIRKGIAYLFRHGGSWTIKPFETTRPSCSWHSAIFVINDTGEEITLSFARIGDMARDIVEGCGSGPNKNRVNGQMQDPRGFSVLLSRSWC